jgi:monoamine oxidase
MDQPDIIIIGAGMCGLSLADILSRKGKKVLVLEGRERVGGRVLTFTGEFGQPLQGGPEFIHGHLAFTMALAKKAGATLFEREDKMYRSENRKIFPVKSPAPGMKQMIKAIQDLSADTTLKKFLDEHFSGREFEALRKNVIKMAEGFDAADPEKISVKSLHEEWTGESLSSSFAIKEGYGKLVDHLFSQCVSSGTEIFLNKTVRKIEWQKNDVTVVCDDGMKYHAAKTVITVPLGVLLSQAHDRAHIRFDPPVNDKIAAAGNMGYGAVVKVLLEFSNRFWDDHQFSEDVQQIPDLGFLMNESVFPVYWVSDRNETPVITAWCGGTGTMPLLDLDDQSLIQKAISGLAIALNCEEGFIRTLLRGAHSFNWQKDPFARGAYSYLTPLSSSAKKILSHPVQETLYFAGEALGRSSGTVEAALESADELGKILF